MFRIFSLILFGAGGLMVFSIVSDQTGAPFEFVKGLFGSTLGGFLGIFLAVMLLRMINGGNRSAGQ